jgi:Short C-terminal domain
MQELTQEAQHAIANLARRYGISEDAVRTMLFAVSAGNGTMAQFYHVELGGGGQWMRGGMTMVGDMFNSGLKSQVDGLCSDLSTLLATQQVFAPQPPSSGAYGNYSAGPWWPSSLGSPSSSGGQNDSQYAYFPGPRRLAVKQSGRLAVYDTLDHQIGGVQQQQGGYSGSFSFTSQFGTFSVDSLPFAPESPGYVPPAPAYAPPPANERPPAPDYSQAPTYTPPPDPPSNEPRTRRTPEEILSAIEGLGDLHRRGLLSDAEFQNKKAELLAQL